MHGNKEHPPPLTANPSLQQSQSLAARSRTEVEDKVIRLHIERQDGQD